MRIPHLRLGLFLLCLSSAAADVRTFSKTQLIVAGQTKPVSVQLLISDTGLTIRPHTASAGTLECPYPAIGRVAYGYLDNRRVPFVPIYGLSALFLKGQSHWLVIESNSSSACAKTLLRLHKDQFRSVIAELNERSGKKVEVLDPTNLILDPAAGSHDEEVVLPFDRDKVLAALTAAMQLYSCKPGKFKGDRLECTRPVHTRISDGGGERVVAILEFRGPETKLSIETHRGIGKDWSSPILRELRNRLEAKP